MVAIRIVNAKKRFQDLWALKGISMEVAEGEFFGLLGPNGAGKTTLIHSMVGLCRLTEGFIQIFDFDSQKEAMKAHALVGFSPQDINLDRFFTIKKILNYQAGFFGASRKESIKKTDHMLELFGLTDKADMQYYKLSGGMQKRLLVAKAVITEPKILILDEPTAGVDVEQRHTLWAYLRKLNAAGTTIVLTTHYIDEAEELCKRISIINQGEIKETGSPTALISKYCEQKLTALTNLVISPEKLSGPWKTIVEGTRITLIGEHMAAMSAALHQAVHTMPDCRILEISMDQGNLERVFLKVTGRKL